MSEPTPSRDQVLARMHVAIEDEGTPPGERAFELRWGIKRSQRARYWPKHSDLIIEAGGKPNSAWTKIPVTELFSEYARVCLALKRIPTLTELRISSRELGARTHKIQAAFGSLASFNENFRQWLDSQPDDLKAIINFTGWGRLPYAKPTKGGSKKKAARKAPQFEELVRRIRHWSPARRRNSEGEYKIELRGHLKSLGYFTNEEYGQSKFDLIVEDLYAIETKKAPTLGDYDRLFGQLARHLQHQRHVISVIFDVQSEDTFSNFAFLVDFYLNRGDNTVELIKK